MRADKAATTKMRLETLTALENIERIEKTITEETEQFFEAKTEAEIRLKDQSEAIYVYIGRVEAQMTKTQKIFTDIAVITKKLGAETRQGDKIICTPLALK